MRSRSLHALVATLVIGACGAPGPEAAAPATLTIVSTPAPSATAESPPPKEDPLPACEARAARAPVGFSTPGVAGVELLPRSDRALAPVQAVYEAWLADLGEHSTGDCHLVRNDGDLLSFSCSSSFFTGNGGVRAGPEVSFVFARASGGWNRVGLPELLPASPVEPRKLLDPICKAQHSAVTPSELELTPQPDLDAWLNVIEPGPGGLHLQVGWGPGGSAGCVAPYDALVRAVGCGPLAPLARPEFVREPGAPEPPPALAVLRVDEGHDGDWHFPRFSSHDPRRQAVVATLEREMSAWRLSVAAASPANRQCDVTLSTDALVSVLCTSTEGTDGSRQMGFTYRLADGARIGPEALFAASPGALRATIRRCLGEHVRRPKDDHDETLDRLPTLSPASFAGFALGGDAVRFVVAYEPKTRKGEVRPRTTYCHTPLAELKTSLEALAKPAR